MDNEVQIEIAQMKDAQAQPHRFIWRFQYDEGKSLSAGRPIYEPAIFVEVVSGQGTEYDVKYVRANEFHFRKFPVAWKQFKDNVAPEVDMGIYDPLTVHELKAQFPELYEKYCARVGKKTGGTLLCEWNQCPAQLALELKHWGIFTVEDLVDSTEECVPESLRVAGKEYIAACADSGHINQLAAALIKAKEIIDRQQREIESLRHGA